MVRTPSTMTELGAPMPDFSLPDVVTGGIVSADDVGDARGVLVVFMCNHCPYVKHVRRGLADFAREYSGRGLALVGVNANDVEAHPEDAPERMREEARTQGYGFPYLFDETQEVAKAFRAACTPDFFLYDGERRLVYRGQFDDSRPGSDTPVTGEDLRAAADAVLEGRAPPEEQRPSVGCNIKWKPGNAPDYFG
ncbi:MAG TPA: thioredoxin family protein [Candidatus Thermoplasmatota archaeon]